LSPTFFTAHFISPNHGQNQIKVSCWSSLETLDEIVTGLETGDRKDKDCDRVGLELLIKLTLPGFCYLPNGIMPHLQILYKIHFYIVLE